MAKNKKPTVALVYDFDGTLSPGNMQEFGFIQAIGKDKDEFWKKNKELSEPGGQDRQCPRFYYPSAPGL